MADWTEVYRPNTLNAIRGNDKACTKLREWATQWPGEGRAVILHGSPGVGKTSAAHALASELDWEPIELNASEQRTASVIDRIAGEAAASATLTGKNQRRLVILDEADNLHGNVDRGGAAAITKLVKETQQPIVLIANEFYDMSRGLRNACDAIEFRNISARSILPVLRDICRKEEIEFDEAALKQIAESTAGDLRSAINDLQAIAERADRLTVEHVVTGDRDRTTDIFPFLDTVFKTATAQEALEAAYALDETPDDTLAWVEDNVPKDYNGAELARAYRYLANADRWLGRVQATQNYQYWRYATDNIAGGVAAAREETKGGWTRYGPPRYWRKLGSSRSARDRRDYVARHIAEAGHMSTASARREVLPFLSAMTHHCQNRELTIDMAAQFELDENHVSFVTGSGADTKKVGSIIEAAEARRTPEIESTPWTPEQEAAIAATEEANDEPAEETPTEDGDGQAGLGDFL